MPLNTPVFSLGFSAHDRNATASPQKNGSPSDPVGGWGVQGSARGGGGLRHQIFCKKACGGDQHGEGMRLEEMRGGKNDGLYLNKLDCENEMVNT